MRLATFNMLHGKSLTDGLVDLDRFADAVRTLDADVLALQGVDRGQLWRRSAQSAPGAVVLDTPESPLTVVATHLTLVAGWNSHQLRLLVRFVRDLPRPLVGALTIPVAAPVRQIDHILGVGPVRPTSDGASLDLGVSDHRALVADVELYAEAPPIPSPGQR